jgi:hypothetical protein
VGALRGLMATLAVEVGVVMAGVVVWRVLRVAIGW